MMTARGKLQRIVAGDISIIGRNTQGVRIMSLDEGDTLAAVVRVPRDENDNGAATASPGPAATGPVEPVLPSPQASATDRMDQTDDDVDEADETDETDE